jgi:hypothetical protein
MRPAAFRQPFEVPLVELSRPHAVHVHPRLRAQHAQRELHGGHFEAEHHHGPSVAAQGHILRDGQRERRLSHRRTRREHHQTALLKAVGLLVEILEVRADAFSDAARGVHVGDELERLVDDGAHLFELLGLFVLRDVEHEFLGFVEQIFEGKLTFVGHLHDLAARPMSCRSVNFSCTMRAYVSRTRRRARSRTGR